MDATFVEQLGESAISVLPYVSKAELRGRLRADVRSLQCWEWNVANYHEVLPSVVAEIWRSYLERTINEAVLVEKNKRLECQLELQSLKERLNGPPFTLQQWLHDVAEKDKREINFPVRMVDCSFSGITRSSDTPSVCFTLTVMNGSVYTISIERQVGGFISYGNRRLTGEITMSPKWIADNIEHGYSTHVEICQWLSRDEADFLEEERNEVGSRESFFDFEQLIIYVKGGDGFPDVAPKPLRFVNGSIRGIDMDGRLR